MGIILYIVCNMDWLFFFELCFGFCPTIDLGRLSVISIRRLLLFFLLDLSQKAKKRLLFFPKVAYISVGGSNPALLNQSLTV